MIAASSLDRFAPLGLALLVVCGPAMVGMALGWTVREILGKLNSQATRAALVITPIGAALPVAQRVQLVGAWDALVIATALAAGLAAGSCPMPAPRGAFVLAAASACLSLLLAEAAAHVCLPAPPAFPAAREAHLLLPAREQAATPPTSNTSGTVCHFLYKDTWPPWSNPADPTIAFAVPPSAAAFAPAARHSVLHLGDSMVYGMSVQHDRAFPSLLAELEPDTTHVNGGIATIGPDVYYALAEKWLAVSKPERIVVHVFLGNDIGELDQPYPCCAGGPLLEYPAAAPPRLRCATPRAADSTTLRWFVESSPLPYPLRVATEVSTLARHVAGKMAGLLQPRPVGHDKPEKLRKIFGALRDRTAELGVKLVVSILPLRSALEPPEPAKTQAWVDHEMVRGMAVEFGIPVLSAWELFDAAMRRDPSASWFAPELPGDVHFGVAGHRLYADWLHERPELH